jgi:hypothetical protein
MFDAQKKVAAQSKDVADKLIFHAQENEFSTGVKGDVGESVAAQTKDVAKGDLDESFAAKSNDVAEEVKLDAQENDFLTDVNGDGDESTSGSSVDCSALINTPPPRKSSLSMSAPVPRRSVSSVRAG